MKIVSSHFLYRKGGVVMEYKYAIINERSKKYLNSNLPKKDNRKNNNFFYLKLNKRNAI